jgi:hypothetical protein
MSHALHHNYLLAAAAYLEIRKKGLEVLKNPSLLLSLLAEKVTTKLSRVWCVASPRTSTLPLRKTTEHSEQLPLRYMRVVPVALTLLCLQSAATSAPGRVRT